MSFQTGVTELYNEYVSKGVTPSGQTLADMKAAVISLYNKGKTDGTTIHTTTYTLTASEKTKDLGASHNYRYINANNVYNAGSNSAHQTGTYVLGTKASAAASTYDMGASNKYRYINATAAWNKASSTGYTSGTAAGSGSLIQSTSYTITTMVALGSTATHTKAITCTKVIGYGITDKSLGDDCEVHVTNSAKNIITKITYTYSKNINLTVKVWYV